MARKFSVGDCVRIPDGRVGRVCEDVGKRHRVRVRRKTSATLQFLVLSASDLRKVACPQGTMSLAGYVRYLKVTLSKMRPRQAGREQEIEHVASYDFSVASDADIRVVSAIGGLDSDRQFEGNYQRLPRVCWRQELECADREPFESRF